MAGGVLARGIGAVTPGGSGESTVLHGHVTQAAIQRGEERWLGTLSDTDRAMFLRVLEQLSNQS